MNRRPLSAGPPLLTRRQTLGALLALAYVQPPAQRSVSTLIGTGSAGYCDESESRSLLALCLLLPLVGILLTIVPPGPVNGWSR